MRMKLLFVPVVLMSALIIADGKPQEEPADAWPTQWTTEAPGLNLNGKMFTLARYSSGVTLYRPYFPISSLSLTPKTRLKENAHPTSTRPYTTPKYITSTRPYTTPKYITSTRPYTTPTYPPWTRPYTTPTYPPWTTAPPMRGVTVCLRYMIDPLDDTRPTIFTLSPSGSFLSLRLNSLLSYEVRYYYSATVKLQPTIRLWPGISPSPWTSVCITTDSNKRVVQMFKGSYMSIRKVLPSQYDWSGEPVMEFSGIAGQVKDIQVWNYPCRYKEIYYYMTGDSYWSKQGNVLSWSHISYSLKGQSFLEDSYESQATQPVRRGGLKRAKSREFFTAGENKETKKMMI